MTLNIYTSGVEDYAEKFPTYTHAETGQEMMNVITQTVGFSNMFVHIPHITPDNWKTFYRRIHAWERAFEPTMCKRGEDGKMEKAYVTAQNIYDLIGLRVNVTPMTDARWKTYFIGEVMAEADRNINRVYRQIMV